MGSARDLPAVVDFDGDGKTDLAVYRPATAEWYVRLPTPDYSAQPSAVYQWGLPGDIPLGGILPESRRQGCSEAAGASSCLSDRTWISMTNGWGPAELDRSNGESAPGDGGPLRMDGVTYAKGLGVHAPSDLRYAIAGCTAFASIVGVDDESGAKGSVVFQVWVDGVPRYDSGAMTGTSASRVVNLELTGANELRLVLTDGGDGNTSDHGDWADARLECGPDTTAPTVTPTAPTPNATGVPVDANATATFSEPMQVSTLTAATSTLVRQDGSMPVPATVSYDPASRTLTLDPTASLAAATLYTVTIKGGASGVKDVAGNPLAIDRVWSFTTAAVATAQFRSPTSYPAGLNPHSLTAADINRDGTLDLIAANAGSSQVSVFLGHGDGMFGAASTWAVGATPKHVELVDLNADSFTDLVTANQDGSTVTVLMGHGDGTFAGQVSYPVCFHAHESAAADFNGDGKPDLVVSCWGGSVISMLIGRGDGTFNPAAAYGVQDGPVSLVAGDFNRDTTPDVAVGNGASNSVSILISNGDGTLRPAVNYPGGAGPHGIRSADLNGDGFLDLVNADSGSAQVTVLLGNGDGTFRPKVDYQSGIAPTGIALADVTADGIIDILTANTANNYPDCCNPGGNTFSVLVGRGDGTFNAPAFYTTGLTPFAIAVGDFNGDSRPDVATANWHSNDVSVILNAGGDPLAPLP